MSTNGIHVISTCTSRKVPVRGSSRDPGRRTAAERLYAGEQHRRLMQGVDLVRAQRDVDVWIISARWGVVCGKELLEPYDETLTSLSRGEVHRQANATAIPESIRAVARRRARLLLLLVGNHYFDAAGLDEAVDWASPTAVLLSGTRAARFRPHPRARVLKVGQEEAKRFRLPLTLLKGELAKRILELIAAGHPPSAVAEPDYPLLDRLEETRQEAVAS